VSWWERKQFTTRRGRYNFGQVQPGTRQRGEPLTEEVFERLLQSKRWVQLAGYISLGCAALTVISAFATFLVIDTGINTKSTIFLFEVFIACAYATPAIYLLRYGHAIGEAARKPGTASLAEALRMQLRYWRFIGLLFSISVALAIIAFAMAMLIPILWRLA
jgi:hypothetical protein